MTPGHLLAVVTPYTVPTGLMDVLQVTVLLLVAAAATMVVLIRVPTRQVIALSVYGILLAVLFLVFQAPDVTLSELTVGAVALPVMQIFPFAVVVWILAVGLYGIITSRHLMHLIVCLIVVQSSTYVLLLGVGYKTGAVAPYFFDVPNHTPAVDPVVQALALTDVVVEAAVTALLLAIAIQAHKRFGTLDPQELVQLKG